MRPLNWATLAAIGCLASPIQAAEPPTTQNAATSTVEESDEPNWFVKTKSSSTGRSPEPPSYIKPLSLSPDDGEDAEEWLLFGFEQRSRYERRDDNYLTDLGKDNQIMMRTRAYLGIEEALDPFRFGIEFQDSRQFMSDFPDTDKIVNEADLLQAFGELYFDDAIDGKPLRFQFGRTAVDYVDRRQRTRNGFRNTTNSFDGFRLHIGEPQSDWEFDVFAAQPVERHVRKFDHGDDEKWFYGVTGTWRRWSKVATIEPYYFVLDEDRKDPTREDREIHTFGVHAYGLIGDTGFDYDLDAAFQVGESGDRDHRAFAARAELAYTIPHDWKPRLSFWVNYASGDKTADDDLSERFDSLFGSSHTFYSFLDLFPWQNIINPTFQIKLRPTDKLYFEAYYRAYWLASDNDGFIRAGRFDPTGRSDDFIGQEIDLLIRYTVNEHLSFQAGYAHFFPGDFVQNTGPSPDSDLFYIMTTIRF